MKRSDNCRRRETVLSLRMIEYNKKRCQGSTAESSRNINMLKELSNGRILGIYLLSVGTI